MDDAQLAALRGLADPVRVRLLGRLLETPADAAALAAATGLDPGTVHRGLDSLVRAGLVDPAPDERGRRHARPDRIGAAGAALAALERTRAGAPATPGGAWPHDGEPLEATLDALAFGPDERRVLGAFLVDGRLAAIPVAGRRRELVLRFLRARVFTEARGYPEKEVNQRLAPFHPDVAALRRYLVEAGLVTRADGVYRTPGEGRGAAAPGDDTTGG